MHWKTAPRHCLLSNVYILLQSTDCASESHQAESVGKYTVSLSQLSVTVVTAAEHQLQ